MSYDITFCSNLNCKNKDCDRNQNNIEDEERLISIAEFKDCEYWEEIK